MRTRPLVPRRPPRVRLAARAPVPAAARAGHAPPTAPRAPAAPPSAAAPAPAEEHIMRGVTHELGRCLDSQGSALPRKRCAGAQAVRRCAPPGARAAPAQAPPRSAPGVAQKKLSRSSQEHSKRLEWDQIWAENPALLGGKVRSDTCQHPQPGACAHRLHTPVPQRIRTVRRLFRPLPPPSQPRSAPSLAAPPLRSHRTAAAARSAAPWSPAPPRTTRVPATRGTPPPP